MFGFKSFIKKVEETTDKIGTSSINAIKEATKEAAKATKEAANASKGGFDTFMKSSENLLKSTDSLIKKTTQAVTTTSLPESLKKTLSVDIDIDAALRPVLNPLTPSGPSPAAILYKENVDLHPGSIYLDKYQEKLKELHSNNVILARKAEAVDRKLPTLLRLCTNHNDMWKRLQGELSKLPELSANVSNIRNQIDFVLVKFDELEFILGQHVEAYHSNELGRYKAQMMLDTTKYQIQKQKELASLEEELATTRARYDRDRDARDREQARLQRQEQERQRRKREEEEKKQQEKLRSAFGNAFQHQFEQFKKFGTTTPSSTAPSAAKPAATSTTTSTPIENFVPEENPTGLEDFLKDSSDKVAPKAAEEEAREVDEAGEKEIHEGEEPEEKESEEKTKETEETEETEEPEQGEEKEVEHEAEEENKEVERSEKTNDEEKAEQKEEEAEQKEDEAEQKEEEAEHERAAPEQTEAAKEQEQEDSTKEEQEEQIPEQEEKKEEVPQSEVQAETPQHQFV